jgi:hypothetical protein
VSEPAKKRATDKLRLVSHFPGRLRVRAETFRALPEVAEEVAERLREQGGVSDVRTSPVTGSLVVTYDPHALQLPRLIQILIRTGGLHGIEVDRVDDWTRAVPQGTRVRDAFAALRGAVQGKTNGKIDLKVAVPGALAAMGAGLFLFGRPRMPFWYDFLFWSFVSFHNMNPTASGTATESGAESERKAP